MRRIDETPDRYLRVATGGQTDRQAGRETDTRRSKQPDTQPTKQSILASCLSQTMADVQPADSVVQPPQPQSPPATPPPSHNDLPPIFAGSTSPSFAANASAPSALARLTLTDKLLLAQVVHHLAESPPNWASVSNFMLSHPLIKNPSRLKSATDANLSLARIFGTRECERAWTALMRQYNLVAGDEEPVQTSAASQIKQRPKEAKGAQPRIDRKSQLSLAQILYAERMEELRDAIKKKEEEFKALIDRIDQIKSNALDDQLQEQANHEAKTTDTTTTPTPSTSAPAADHQQQQHSTTTTADSQSSSRGTRRRPSQPDKPEEPSTQQQAPSTSQHHPSSHIVNRKDDGDQRDVEDVLGGGITEQQQQSASDQPAEQQHVASLDHDRDPAKPTSPSAQDEPETEDQDETAPQQPEKPSETRRSKRKRTDTDVEEDTTTDHPAATDDDQPDAADVPPTPARDTKRTRSSTHTEDAAPPPARTPKSRPPITPRRSRRGGANKDTDQGSGQEDDDDEPEDESMDVTADEATTTTNNEATPARSRSTAASVPRRSLRGRGSTQSREASVRTDDHDEDAAGADDADDADMSSSTLKAERDDGDVDIVSSRRSSRRETAASRRASSSARHSVESSSTREQREREREKRRKANEKVLLQIWTEVSAHTHGNLFQNVVKESDAPDYHSLIRHPTSLKLIKTQIKEGEVQTITQLRRAFNHLFANALMYNRPNTEVGRMAREMRDETEAILDRFEETRRLASRR